jgi:predicted RNA-binding protein with PUA domain
MKAGSIFGLIKNQVQNQKLESKFTTKGVKLLYKNFILSSNIRAVNVG